MEKGIDPMAIKVLITAFGVIFTIITALLIYYIKKIDKGKDKRIDEIIKVNKEQEKKIVNLEKETPQYEKIIDICDDMRRLDRRINKIESMQLGKKEIVNTINDAVDNAVARWENKMLKEGILQPKRRDNDN